MNFPPESPKIINQCPIDLVSTSMNNLSLLRVPPVGSNWPEMNIGVGRVDIQSNNDVKESNSPKAVVGNVGYSRSPKIQNCPIVVNDCSANSTNYDTLNANAEIYSDLEELSNDMEEVASIVNRYSGNHRMNLRPRQASPRHCIVTLFDSEDEESTDSDYTVDDSDEDSSTEDSSSSGDYSTDSEDDSSDSSDSSYSEDSDASIGSCSKEVKIIDKFEELIDRLASSDEESYGSCGHSEESDSEIANKYLRRVDDVMKILPKAMSAYSKVAEKESREAVAGASGYIRRLGIDSSDDSDDLPDDEQSSEDEQSNASANGQNTSEDESTSSSDDLSEDLDEDSSDDDDSVDLEDSSDDSSSDSSDSSD